MKKLLFITNIVSGNVSNFSISSIIASQSLGYHFHLVGNCSEITENRTNYEITVHHIDLVRNPLNLKNLKAYKQLLNLIKKENFDVIHCNTPIGGILGRLCGRMANVPKIIYTAHGFHFYKGAPLFNGILFQWAEKWMAHFTDALITINKEDYQAAQTFKLRRSGKVYFIPGVGVDLEPSHIDDEGQAVLRQSLGLKEEDFVAIAMGDLIRRKNYAASIQALAKADSSKLHFLICGNGPELYRLQKLARKLGVEERVHFLGYRSDIKELLAISDLFLFTTYQEGLPRSLMEAMAAGVPCLVSKIRGNVDLIEEGEGGFLIPPDDVQGFTDMLNVLSTNPLLRKKMCLYNLSKIKNYDVSIVKQEMIHLYMQELGTSNKLEGLQS